MFSKSSQFYKCSRCSLPSACGGCGWLEPLFFSLLTEDFLQAKQVYKAALKQAEQKGDADSVRHIQEELAELAKRRKGSQ